MQESWLRKLLNSILDRRSRADTLAKYAAVIAGFAVCLLALSPVMQDARSMTPAVAAAAAGDAGPAPYAPAIDADRPPQAW